MARPPGIPKWLAITLAVVATGFLLLISLFIWLGNYMSEGIVRATEASQFNVLVALTNAGPVREALISSCHLTQSLPASTTAMLSSGLLAEVPSGTKMHMPSRNIDGGLETVTISEGKLKGRQVWVCSGQVALYHAMP